MDLASYIRNIPDFPKPGIQFKDITPLLAAPAAFQEAIRRMMEHYGAQPIDAVAAAEARGFLVAAPLAYLMGKPLVPLRKPGKLPYETFKFQYDLEYGQAELHVHIDGFKADARVLLVDDLLATGGTLGASVKLIEQAGARVASIAVLVELDFLGGREKLRPHEVFSLIRY
jgi:adenine phosphoribosyltransferase